MSAKDSTKTSKYQPPGKMRAKGSERPKRNNSEVSNESMNDTSIIRSQLDCLELSLSDLRDEIKHILKKKTLKT
ncbi:hypothetical protein DPMN_132847 [Dreissena polymorpha]|uniref:Uncharacterized protein n=1 Tax=Dreissena polymorpha TaxID=45954 RepID=A0A9D4JAF6_DREPO|nr:hypothetical protein DPMN_132847 [Dreissena polymorpha]